jgi:hypothetical protein
MKRGYVYLSVRILILENKVIRLHLLLNNVRTCIKHGGTQNFYKIWCDHLKAKEIWDTSELMDSNLKMGVKRMGCENVY